MEINILILSVGTRNKIVQYLKKALTDQEGNRLGSVIATDMSNIAPAIYEADKYYQVPRMMASDYMEVIFDICRKEKITAILSLIDPELSLLAKHEKEFAALSVKVIGSSYELCEMSLDKIQMYEWLTTHGYKTAKSYTDKSVFFKDIELGKISYPVFVKPVRGSASLAISKVNDKETIELLAAPDFFQSATRYASGLFFAIQNTYSSGSSLKIFSTSWQSWLQSCRNSRSARRPSSVTM